MRKPVGCFFCLIYVNNRSKNQLEHPCSLITDFTVHYLKSIMSTLLRMIRMHFLIKNQFLRVSLVVLLV